MTRKLTDEQVQAIVEDRLVLCEISENMTLHIHQAHCFDPDTMIDLYENITYLVAIYPCALKEKLFTKLDEAIAYAEHLLNQRYCWLPQQQAWIMSGEVYNFANNGANKVLELSLIAWQNGFKEDKEDWFFAEFNNEGKVYQEIHGGFPSVELIKGVTIPAESPIWDAVKEVE